VFIYIFLYTILLGFAVFIDRTDTKPEIKRIFLFLLVIVFTLFRGLRWKTGTDWDQFYEVFIYSSWDNIFSYNRYGDKIMEYGYMFLNVLVKSAGFDYTGFLLLTNFFILFSYAFVALKVSTKPILVFAVMLFTTAFFPVRQILASGVIVLCFPYVINGNFLKFLLVVFIASTIHTSSLIVAPIYFFLRFKIKDLWAYILFVAVILFSTGTVQDMIFNFVIQKMGFLGDMVMTRLKSYTEFDRLTEDHRVSLLSQLISFFFLFLFTRIRRYQYENSIVFNVFFNSYLMYFFLSEFFRSSMEQFARTSNYFAFGFPVMLAFTLSDKRINKQHIPIVYLLFIAYMYYKLFTALNYHYPKLHVPYRSIFDF